MYDSYKKFDVVENIIELICVCSHYFALVLLNERTDLRKILIYISFTGIK
jgi:hypothetical protein